MKFLMTYRALILIASFFLIRLYGIHHPPLEVNHNWRQVTGLMVARNYYEGNTDFAHPMIDDIGVGESASTGVVGMEFPILNYLYSSIALLIGYDHWYGRLISLVIGSFGLWWFYLLLRRWRDEKEAFIGTTLLACSVWFAFSRKFMPDVSAISLAIGALYYALRYLDTSRVFFLFSYGLLASLALLIKIPAAVILVSIVALLFLPSFTLKLKIRLIAFSVAPVILASWWYFIWNVRLSQESGIWYNSGESFSQGLMTISSNLAQVAKHVYFSTTMSYVAFALFFAGFALTIWKRDRLALVVSLLILIIFSLYAIKSGRHFVFQHYYLIPLAPLFALLAARFLSSLRSSKVVWIFLLAASIEGVANQAHDFRIHRHNLYKLQLEDLASKYIPEGELIVVNGEGNPQELYLAHRKGWVCSSSQLLDTNYLSRVFESGARFLVVNKHRQEQALPFQLIYSNEDYFLYELNFER
jgi:hypothetical protein